MASNNYEKPLQHERSSEMSRTYVGAIKPKDLSSRSMGEMIIIRAEDCRGQKMFYRIMLILVALPLLIALSACSSTRVDNKHPLIREAPSSEVAMVYFIRPRTERTMGFADNRLPVEADRFHLLTIAKGEYTLIPMVPGNVWISVTSMTSWGARNAIKEMNRSNQFNIEAGETYFIAFNLVDGEFRGAFFIPELIDLHTARELTQNMHPVGRARKSPISSLEG